ncbi:MAG: hypothetical protein LZ169_06825 [Thaumarchaeota archaeon]|jgi:hypothetical protein|nr:hypothetical protein [Candidatus Wolframiiraptor allenii]
MVRRMRHAENRQRLRRMGISGALVAILLVVVAIAFVGIAVAVMGGYLGTASVKTDVMIEKLDLVANGQSVVAVRNTGNVRITSITATLTCDQTKSPSSPSFNLGGGGTGTATASAGLDPGKTISVTWDAGNLIPGETCRLTIEATAANGATAAASASAIVRP